jgi:phosphoglycerate-specific signal transduction histidine kinase
MPTTINPGRPIEVAKDKTDAVQEDLVVAGAELHLTNTALNRSLPQSARHGDVDRALEQNDVVQQKVTQAAEELAEVTELLEEEIAERQRLEAQLEAQLARRGMSENG